MNRCYKVYAAALAASVVCLDSSGATRIVLGDNAAFASTTYTLRDAKYAVNGAGLVGGLHSNTADKVTWMSVTQPTTVSGQWFRVDLGQVFELDRFKLWNFNFWNASVQTTNRGIREAEVYLSSLDTTPVMTFTDPTQWTRVIDKVTFAKAPGQNTYAGEPDVSLAGLQGRWLALRVLTNFSATDFTAGISELQVFAAEKPVMLGAPPTAVEPTQATLPGTLSFDGGVDNTVFAYWGTTDGGSVSSAWDHVVSLGVRPIGPVAATVAVAADSEYFFRFHAVNTSASDWSEANSFLTAPVTVEMSSSVSEGAGVLPVTFRRPAGLTNTTVTLNFGLTGDALAGQDYLQPVTSAVIPAGSTTAQAPITLIDDLTSETNETLTVGLGPSACVLTAAGTNSSVIVDDEGLLDTSRWSRHMMVTLSGYSGATALTNFPVVLRLHEGLSGFRYADFSSPSDGGDLRVTDADTGETQSYEIETWNPAGTSVVWVCVSRLAGTGTALRLHWSNPAAALPGYATGGVAWLSGFGGVWHLKQPNATDSTVNRNHGTAYGGVAAVPAVLGSGLWFSGSNYVQVAHHASIGTNVVNSLTVSTWLKSDVPLLHTNDTFRLLEKGDCYFLLQGYANAGGMVFLIKQNNGVGVYALGNGPGIPADEWHHACATYDGTAMRLYIDGALANTYSQAGSIDDDGLPLRIGSDDSGKYFKGTLDETRIESAVRNASWIKACYDSQKPDASFATFGAGYRTFRGSLITVF